MSNSVRPHRRQPTRLRCPWDSPGKNTGVGCHFFWGNYYCSIYILYVFHIHFYYVHILLIIMIQLIKTFVSSWFLLLDERQAKLFWLTCSKPLFWLCLQLTPRHRPEYHQIFTLSLPRLFYQWTKHSPSTLPVRKLSKKSHSYLLLGNKIDRTFINDIAVYINNFKNVFLSGNFSLRNLS